MTETIDELLEEACEEEKEIEDGYFTEKLKYIIDKDIDDTIDTSMGSLFNADSETTVDLILSDMLLGLESEIQNSSGSEFAKEMIEDDDQYDIAEYDYDWCDDDVDEDDVRFDDEVESGAYNPGYDSLFGDGS